MRFSSRRYTVSLGLFIFLATGCGQTNFGLPEQSLEFSASARYNNKLDLLLLVDNSSSMIQYQNKLAAEVPGMISSLNAKNLDYHIAVITTDMRSMGNGGKFLGTPKFLSNSSGDLVSNLQARVKQGETGSDLERGFESIYTVLSPNYLAGNGSEFLREDALLAIVALSNENDYSTTTTAQMIQLLDQTKRPFATGTKSWIFNFIGVLSLQGTCQTTADFKEAGLKYIELANHVGGINSSICDTSLSQAVANLKSRMVEILSEYLLNREPNPSTLVVKINGTLIPQSATNGWTYDATKNSVSFHGASQPGATDIISVDFTPAGGT